MVAPDLNKSFPKRHGVGGAVFLGSSTGSAFYDAETNFTDAWADNGSTLFDPVAAGWTFVPEPSTALLLAIGLVGLTGRRRRAR